MANLKKLSEEDTGGVVVGDFCRYISGLDIAEPLRNLREAKVKIIQILDNGCVVKLESVNINSSVKPLTQDHEIVALWSELWI